MDGVAAAGGDLIHLGELVAGRREADLQPLGFASPAVAGCLLDAGDQVGPDVQEPLALGGVGAQQGAADAGVLVDAGRPVRAAAGAQ